MQAKLKSYKTFHPPTDVEAKVINITLVQLFCGYNDKYLGHATKNWSTYITHTRENLTLQLVNQN